MDLETKVCFKCKQRKRLDSFSLNRAKPDGRQNWCKQCMKIANAQHYQNGYKKTQNKHNKKNRQRYQLRAKEIYDKIRSEGCSWCSEKDVACLDFHHIDPNEKEIGIYEAINRGWSIDRIKKEIEKCIVLCSNCHRKFHYYERASSNGKTSASKPENVDSISTARA